MHWAAVTWYARRMTSSVAPPFNPFDPAIRSDPYPAYAALLAGPRVQPLMPSVWVVGRHSDCLTVLRSPDTSADPTRGDAAAWYVEASAGRPEDEALRPFLFKDPPEHTRLRGAVQRAFTPKVVERRRARVQAIVDLAVDEAIDKGGLDVVADLAYPVPVQVICELLGVPPEDEGLFGDWSHQLARSLDPDFVLPEDVRARRDAALDDFHAYARRLIELRRHDPGDDLLSALAAGAEMSDDELVATSMLLLIAGHETTVNLIANGVLALCRHPDEFGRLAADPAAMSRGTVDEVLRFDPPIQLTGRTLTAAMDLGDLTVGSGDTVLLALAAANRDPAVFSEPARFDITRDASAHLSFGHGIHHCVGAALARLEGRVTFETLATRLARMELSTDELVYKENFVARGLASLPVTVTPR